MTSENKSYKTTTMGALPEIELSVFVSTEIPIDEFINPNNSALNTLGSRGPQGPTGPAGPTGPSGIQGPTGPSSEGGGKLEFIPSLSSNTKDFTSWDFDTSTMLNVTRKIGTLTHDMSQYAIKHMDGATQVRTDLNLKVPLHGAFYFESENTPWNKGTIIVGNVRGSYAIDMQRFRSNGSQVASGDFSVIGGGADNKVESSFATISGGWDNSIIDGISGNNEYNQPTSYSTIGGGMRNSITADWSTIGGGHKNKIDNDGNSFYQEWDKVTSTWVTKRRDHRFMTIGGGECNFASGHYATIGGGYLNSVTAIGSFIGGGQNNGVSKDHSVIAGGINNRVLGYGSFIGAGEDNRTESICATIMVGSQNKITGTANFSSIINGLENTVTGAYSVIIAGASNEITAKTVNDTHPSYSYIGNGLENSVNGSYSAIVNGAANTTSERFTTICNGEQNNITSTHSTIVNGSANVASERFTTICNGEKNIIAGPHSTITNGASNAASGSMALIGNGLTNTIFKTCSYATILNGAQNVIGGKFEILGQPPYLFNTGKVIEGLDAIPMAFIASGQRNLITEKGVSAAIVNGHSNTLASQYSFIGNGKENSTESKADMSTIVGGARNKIIAHYSFIGNGHGNLIELGGVVSSIVGGINNKISKELSFIGGGQDHNIGGSYGVICGGSKNTVNGWHGVISGGFSNYAFGYASNVAGGQGNGAFDEYCTVTGGMYNLASAKFAQVVGGHHNMALAHDSTCIGGSHAMTRIRGAIASANGGFPTKKMGDAGYAEVLDKRDTPGEAQSLNLVLRAKSTANTPIQLVTGLTPLGDHEVVTEAFSREVRIDGHFERKEIPPFDGTQFGLFEVEEDSPGVKIVRYPNGEISRYDYYTDVPKYYTEQVHVNVLKLQEDQIISFSGHVVGNTAMDESVVFKFEGAAKATRQLIDGTTSCYVVRFIGTPTVSVIGATDDTANWSLTITDTGGYIGLQVNNTQTDALWVATLQSTQLLMPVRPA